MFSGVGPSIDIGLPKEQIQEPDINKTTASPHKILKLAKEFLATNQQDGLSHMGQACWIALGLGELKLKIDVITVCIGDNWRRAFIWDHQGLVVAASAGQITGGFKVKAG
ncbi:Uncharacterized protein Fot_39774 [Forsythia ovata]|uniref:Uncharacterized protein n=1 Tax=Forsythia ovata TaxID=205694 RepID=A0ABD1S5M0_9LAMI